MTFGGFPCTPLVPYQRCAVLRSPLLTHIAFRCWRSLVRSLRAGRGDRTTGPDPSTVGVDIRDFQANDGVQIKFYDLAGQVRGMSQLESNFHRQMNPKRAKENIGEFF